MALIRCLGWAFAELARPIAVSDNTPPLAAASTALHSAYSRAVWTNFNDGDSQRRKMLTARMGFPSESRKPRGSEIRACRYLLLGSDRSSSESTEDSWGFFRIGSDPMGSARRSDLIRSRSDPI